MNYQEFLDAYEADCLQALRNEPKEKGMRSWFDTQKSVIIQMRNFARRSKLDEAAIKGCLTTTVAQPVADERLWSDLRAYLEGGLESPGPLEADGSIDARALIARMDAARAALCQPAEEGDKA